MGPLPKLHNKNLIIGGAAVVKMEQDGRSAYEWPKYVLAFMLLWQWLFASVSFHSPADAAVFLFFSALSFMLSFFHWPVWLSSLLKVFVIVYAVHILYFFNSRFFDGEWLLFFYNEIIKNIIFISTGNVQGLTAVFYAVVFFIVLWVLSAVLTRRLLTANRLLFLLAAAAVYELILALFFHRNDAAVFFFIDTCCAAGWLAAAGRRKKRETGKKKEL